MKSKTTGSLIFPLREEPWALPFSQIEVSLHFERKGDCRKAVLGLLPCPMAKEVQTLENGREKEPLDKGVRE